MKEGYRWYMAFSGGSVDSRSDITADCTLGIGAIWGRLQKQ